jgi:hypothetical protein
MAEGFTRNGEWAPSLGEWLVTRIQGDLAEILCNEPHDWQPIEVFVLCRDIASEIDKQCEHKPKLEV